MAAAGGVSPMPDYFTRKVSSRPRPTATGTTPGSPHTPLFQRSISSLYQSPSGGLRNDDENHIVIELGARFLRIGLAGEPSPRCILNFGPDEQRRLGDYRHWMPELGPSRKRRRGADWGREHELYTNDIRNLDLGLLGDKLERACRKADSEILMLDDRKKRVTLAISSLLPKPVLSVVLSTLFNTFQALSITLFPTSIASVMSSGLRSALVIDIGWEETVVTAIYEFREVLQRRSVRAGKKVGQAMASMLDAELEKQASDDPQVSFDETEEILTRLSWCRTQESDVGVGEPPEAELMSIPRPAHAQPANLKISFRRLSRPVEYTLFVSSSKDVTSDSEESPIPLLLYNTLLALPIDIRRSCVSRIVITGGTSRIPGVKTRIMQDLKYLAEQRGWDPIRSYGKVRRRDQQRTTLAERDNNVVTSDLNGDPSLTATNHSQARTTDTQSENVPASQIPQERDKVLEDIQARNIKRLPPSSEGEIRVVESLGPWAGASLLAALRAKGATEVERDAFLQHGMAGAQGMLVKEKEGERNKKDRQSLVPGGREKAEKASWSLGIWA